MKTLTLEKLLAALFMVSLCFTGCSVCLWGYLFSQHPQSLNHFIFQFSFEVEMTAMVDKLDILANFKGPWLLVVSKTKTNEIWVINFKKREFFPFFLTGTCTSKRIRWNLTQHVNNCLYSLLLI